MPELDLILRNGTIVGAKEHTQVDVGIQAGKIVALDANLSATSAEEIDAVGLFIFPGVIDAHVHFNEPGRAHWEGFETGSRSVAAGGGTLFFDMPLNAHPPTLDAESFDMKLAAARTQSLVDFAFWGGLVPQNLGKLEELAGRGVIGFKAFMANSGIDDFPQVDDTVLREGMECAARFRLPIAVHAESEAITRKLAEDCLIHGRTTIRDYLSSRPIAAELEAIRRALDLAGETGCALHVVHVSCGTGVRLIAEARSRGIDVSCETCPHYLALTEADLERIGAPAKCAPPLRMLTDQQELWDRLFAGDVTTVGSDHSPAPPESKTSGNFFEVWGGISGAQHMLPLLLTEGHFGRDVPLPLLGRMLAANVAARFKLPGKGGIAVGKDADFALVDLSQTFSIVSEELFYRHRQSPFLGRKLRGKIRRTILRGRTVFRDGKIVAKPAGNLVKPEA